MSWSSGWVFNDIDNSTSSILYILIHTCLFLRASAISSRRCVESYIGRYSNTIYLCIGVREEERASDMIAHKNGRVGRGDKVAINMKPHAMG